MAVRIIDKHWYVDLRSDGKRYRRKSPEDSKKGALAFQAVLLGRISRGEPIDGTPINTCPLFGDFVQQWFKSYVVANNKTSVRVTKRDIIKNHLTPFFGKHPLDQITSWMIEQFKTKKQKDGLKAKTINNILSVLRTCLAYAHEWELIDKTIRIKALKTVPPPTKYLSIEELNLLLEDKQAGVWNDMTLVAAHTGMRYGELCGLHWEDVNLQTKTIHVRLSLVRKEFTTPKSGKTRIIPMSEAVFTKLSLTDTHGPLVFMREDGRQITKGMGLPNLHKICDRVGIKRIGWHTLRHTFATMLVDRGRPLMVVKELLGHSTIKMTERYAHVPETSLTQAVLCLDNLASEDSLGSIWAVNSQRLKLCDTLSESKH